MSTAGGNIVSSQIGLGSKCREGYHGRDGSQTELEGKVTITLLAEAWREMARHACMCACQMKPRFRICVGNSQARKAGEGLRKDYFSNGVYQLAIA